MGRQLTFILTIIVTTTFSACGQTKTKSNFEKSKIEIEEVDFIEINNKPEQLDTIPVQKKFLAEQQKEEFVNKWNNSKSVGLVKSITRYFITVHFKDGSSRRFKGSEQCLKEGNDFGFDLGDNKYLEKLWNKVNSNQSNTKFFIKDESKYSQTFLTEFKARHSVYETVSLIDDTIIVNNDRVGHIIIPTDLPLNQQVTYQKTENSKKQVLTVKRINYSTLEYNYYEESNGQKTNGRQGTADLEPVFYFGAEGTFEDENENVYGMNEYIDNSEKDCWTNIYVGIGSIEKSFLVYDCKTERNALRTPELTRTN